jgi:hypothetical protein
MPRSYPPEVRRQVIELARAGTKVSSWSWPPRGGASVSWRPSWWWRARSTRCSWPRGSPQKALPGDRVSDRAGNQRAAGLHRARRVASGYYAWKDRPDAQRTLRRIWLAGEIADVHKESGGTYGALRVTAELKFGRGISVGHNAVGDIMRRLGLKGLLRRRLPRGAKLHTVTSLDLVGRRFRRDRRNELWVTRTPRPAYRPPARDEASGGQAWSADSR